MKSEVYQFSCQLLLENISTLSAFSEMQKESNFDQT
jgi:hypothetical protein